MLEQVPEQTVFRQNVGSNPSLRADGSILPHGAYLRRQFYEENPYQDTEGNAVTHQESAQQQLPIPRSIYAPSQ